jgi:hypothetical protein
MKAAVDMNGVEQRSFKQWARDAWSEFLDLIKVSDAVVRQSTQLEPAF